MNKEEMEKFKKILNEFMKNDFLTVAQFNFYQMVDKQKFIIKIQMVKTHFTWTYEDSFKPVVSAKGGVYLKNKRVNNIEFCNCKNMVNYLKSQKNLKILDFYI